MIRDVLALQREDIALIPTFPVVTAWAMRKKGIGQGCTGQV